MKIIDLLNKIANGEEVPKKIKYDNLVYEYYEQYDYKNELQMNYYSVDNETDFFNNVFCYSLNDEVEILDDEENGLPEKINNWTSAVGVVDDSNIEEYVHKLFEQQTQLYFKVNSIIDYLEKQSKGE